MSVFWQAQLAVPSPYSPGLVIQLNVYVPGDGGFEPQRLRGGFWMSRGLSEYSSMSEVCAPKYSAGLVFTMGSLVAKRL